MQATAKYRRFGRQALVGTLLLPLLATGPCLTTAEQSVINGFFDAVTPLLIEQAAADLGVTAPTEFTPPTGGQTLAGGTT
jgi:hypothetical protein